MQISLITFRDVLREVVYICGYKHVTSKQEDVLDFTLLQAD
jgi:hypothetical protein